ncbi:MAG: CapA family protein [Lachnospiraceae bacterium]|nr:CapA family protein [Lachnospiraceae bacterium]
MKRKRDWIAFLITLSVVLVVGSGILFLIGRKQQIENGTDLQGKTEGEESFLSEEKTCENVLDNVWNDSEPEKDADSGEILEEAETEYPSEEDTIILEDDKSGTISISFAGDMLFDDGYATMNRFRQCDSDVERIFTNGLLEVMKAPELFMVNNEFTFTTRGTPLENKAFTFRAKPENVSIYNDMGVDIVGLANNHITDFGMESLYDTLDTLDEAGLVHVGAGRDLNEASRIQYYRKGDLKIAIVCATQIERLGNPDTKGATEDSPGTFRCFDPQMAVEKIKEAKQNADFVIFYVHWGTEKVEEPDYHQNYQVPLYVEAGADAIIGGHPHILQKIDYVEDTPVFYSLGNFWFSSKTTDTGLAELVIGKDGLVSTKFTPCVSKSCVLNLSEGEEKERILSHLQQISPGVRIDSDGYIEKKE